RRHGARGRRPRRGGGAGRSTAQRAGSNGKKAGFAKAPKKAPPECVRLQTQKKIPRRWSTRGKCVVKESNMAFVPSRATARNPNPTSITENSSSTGPDGWRLWWQTEASRQGSDWPSIIAAHFSVVDRLRDADDADARIGCSS